jgi:TRAP-type C4-dicarboxylate transport system substrate-binding protein
VISEGTWSGLTEEERGWIRRAARESTEFQRQAWADGVEEALRVMESEGVTIHQADPAPFMEVTESVRAKYATGAIKSIVERIQNVPAP